ncbi:MAG: CaiB/BaiF CoA transferase family protein [Acidimicrobiia bacterium]
MPLPLAGITIVGIEQAVAAPFATRQLADRGARVIKVERPGVGDFARGYDERVKGLASYFVWLNRSKESLSLDLKADAAGDVLGRLLAGADVFIQNLAPGAAARLGLGADVLRAANPRLIVCDVSGYGTSGPYVDKKAYDLLVQCEAGLLSVTGTPADPVKAGISVADIAGGMYAYSAILTALFHRERTGEGVSIEVSLFDALTEWMSHPMYFALYSGQPPARTGSSHATVFPYGSFATGDGSAVQLGIQNEREWQRFCESVLELPDVATDPRFVTNGSRSDHRIELTEVIERVFASMTAEQVIERLDGAGIANARQNEIADLIAHPQLSQRDRWREVDTPNGPIAALRPPAIMHGLGERFDAIPGVGEHTDAILAELGYDPAAVALMRADGTI